MLTQTMARKLSTIAKTMFDKDGGCISGSVLLYNRDKNGKVRYLALKRAERKTHPGTYSLPGGRANPGETPAQAAARETFEEIGYWPDKVTPVASYTSKRGKLCVIFMAEAHRKFNPRFGQDYKKEHSAFEWSKLKSWPKPTHHRIKKLFNEHGRYIKDIAKGRLEPQIWIETPRSAPEEASGQAKPLWQSLEPIAHYFRKFFEL